MESISAFDIIKVGIGPSSSHTMGPWKAALAFLDEIKRTTDVAQVKSINIHLYGSLALTGLGHGTDVAILLGLSGEDFENIDPEKIPRTFDQIKTDGQLNLGGHKTISFCYEKDLCFHRNEFLPFHSNGMGLEARLINGGTLQSTYYSLGGGFICTEGAEPPQTNPIRTAYPCHNAASIQRFCDELQIGVGELVLLNEQAWRSKEEIHAKTLSLWEEMKACIFRGVNREGILPGGLEVRRRAARLSRKLLGISPNSVDEWIVLIKSGDHSFPQVNKCVSCFALAVNEENAAFGRIITAPTNGAAGVLPAVMMYAHCFAGFDEAALGRFILVAGEIGTLYKKNATISAAMGGCQAEIGVSSSMAAGALADGLGGTPQQVLMAAEIAMEHHLGMTCDPVGGLVQIPCIERNSMGAMKAITAAHIAIDSDPANARVSLDDVIQTMWATAQDMNHKYKETSEGGLAVNISVNVPEC